ncbi:PD-(D/E)XK nuclease family protein [Bacillus sp. FJAT-45037]|uniref:PD-(D/E)XK nuclease family protein n=1 Tax=Bacillus sp. FJAT-45037 TaxID=2011007 RepID=UPI000C243609|nr:PD-(D/E)XK nuclease family protein [Bacillus sp. FJAT-45037]
MQNVTYTSFKDVANEQRLHDALNKQRQQSEPVFYLLPSSKWLKTARARQPGIKFTTFDDVAKYIVDQVEKDVTYLDEQERTLFFSNMLKTNTRYQKIRANQSKVKGLADTYGQLKRLGLSLSHTPHSLQEVRPLFAEYEQETVEQRKMYDPENTVLRAIDILQTEQVKLSAIYIDGYVDFSPIQAVFLQALVQADVPIEVYIPNDQAHQVVEDTKAILLNMGFEQATDTEKNTVTASKPVVNILAATTQAEEMRAVLEEIHSSEIPYDDIGVVLVNEKRGLKQFETLASTYDIPLQTPRKKSLNQTVTFQLLIMLMRSELSIQNRFERLPLVDKLFQMFSLRGANYAKAKAAFLKTGDFIDQEIAEVYSTIDQLTWPKKGTFLSYLTKVSELVRTLKLEERWLNAREKETETARLKETVLEERTVEYIEKMLVEYSHQLQIKQLTNLEMTHDVFIDWLKEAGAASDLYIERGNRRGVALHSWRDLGLFKGEKLYIIGMNEGAFPSAHHLGGYIIEKDLYQLPIVGSLPTQEHFRKKQLAYFEQLLLSSPTLTFTYTKGLDPNHPLLPSPFLDGWSEEEVSMWTFDRRMNQSVSYSLLDQEEKMAYQLGLGKKVTEMSRNLEQLTSRIERLQTSREPIEPTHQQKLSKSVVSVTALESYARCPFKFGLERVLNIQEAQKVKEEVSPLDIGQMVHDLIESVYTELNLVGVKFGECTEEMKSRVLPLLETKFEDLWSEIETISFDLSRPDLMLTKENWWKRLVRWWQAERKLFWDNQQLTDMKIDALEASVRLEFEIEDGKQLILTGKVDRVDRDENGFAIYDYKTGFAQVKMEEDVRTGLKLQLPLYARAMKQAFTEGESVISAYGASYISLKEPEKRAGNGIWRSDQVGKGSRFLVHFSCKNKEEDLGGDDFIETYELKQKIKELWTGTSTEFPVQPLDCSAHCPHQAICRVTEEQKEGEK